MDTAAQKRQKNLERLRSFRPMDDEYQAAGRPYQVIEDMRKEEHEEGIKEGMRTAALRMIADGTLALEKIAEYVGLSLDEVKNLQSGQST